MNLTMVEQLDRAEWLDRVWGPNLDYSQMDSGRMDSGRMDSGRLGRSCVGAFRDALFQPKVCAREMMWQVFTSYRFDFPPFGLPIYG